jgi:hypothetical protein
MDAVTIDRMGYKIPPYRLACMSKSVHKIMQELTSPTPVSYSVDEAMFILDQARAYIEKGGDPDAT